MTNTNNPIKTYDDFMYQKIKEWDSLLGKSTTVVVFFLATVLTAIVLTLIAHEAFIILVPFSALVASYLTLFPLNNKHLNIQADIKRARLQFLESYGVEITDFELNQLNFPNSGGDAEQKIYGIADAVDTKTGAIIKVTLKGLSNGRVALFDNQGEQFQPCEHFNY